MKKVRKIFISYTIWIALCAMSLISSVIGFILGKYILAAAQIVILITMAILAWIYGHLLAKFMTALVDSYHKIS